MRRGFGIQGIKQAQAQKAQAAELGKRMEEQDLATMAEQLSEFK